MSHESKAESRHARLRVATSWEEVAIGKNVRDARKPSQRRGLQTGGCRKGKSSDFIVYKPLFQPMVRKGTCGDFIPDSNDC